MESDWSLQMRDVPAGKQSFRIVASAPHYTERASEASAPYQIRSGIGPFGKFSFTTTKPTRTGSGWGFEIQQPSLIDSVHLRLQTSPTAVEGSWITLPGGDMNRLNGIDWVVTNSNWSIPTGDQNFRVVASAPGYPDRISEPPLGTLSIQGPSAFGTVTLGESRRYALASFSWANPIVFVQALAKTVVEFFSGPDRTKVDSTIAVGAEPDATVRVDVGGTLEIPALNVGANAQVIIKGTIQGDLALIVATDGATIVATDGATLLGQDGTSLAAIKLANSLRNGTASVVAGGAGNVVAGGAGNVIAGGAGNLVSNYRGSPLGTLSIRASSVASTNSFPGIMTVTGDFQLGAGTGMAIALAGTNTASGSSAPEYDQLLVGGRADLDGAIGFGLFSKDDVNERTNVFSPAIGAIFDIVIAKKIKTERLTVRGPIWADGLHFNWSVVTRPDGKEALRLAVVRISPPLVVERGLSGLELAYPTNYSGFALQMTPSLNAATWRPVEIVPAAAARVTLNPTNSAAFFRLVKR
jgi:hypothetical protein